MYVSTFILYRMIYLLITLFLYKYTKFSITHIYAQSCLYTDHKKYNKLAESNKQLKFACLFLLYCFFDNFVFFYRKFLIVVENMYKREYKKRYNGQRYYGYLVSK